MRDVLTPLLLQTFKVIFSFKFLFTKIKTCYTYLIFFIYLYLMLTFISSPDPCLVLKKLNEKRVDLMGPNGVYCYKSHDICPYMELEMYM